MIHARGATGAGTLVAVVLLVLAAGAAVYLGVERQRLTKANRALSQDCAALRQERDDKAKTIEDLTAQRNNDQSEITRLRQSADERALAVAKLREQISSLETRAAALQDEIAKARSDGTLKEGRIVELTRTLEQTKESADKAQGQLRALGYTKDELNDQVAKLQTRLGDSQNELAAARRMSAEQEKAIASLNTDLSTSKGEAAALRKTADALQHELDLRPRPSVPLEPDTYKPSRDRKPRAGAR